ncbi:MAG: hypothetical protein ABIH34_06385, partial [Nanoarchaeota archaeon]
MGFWKTIIGAGFAGVTAQSAKKIAKSNSLIGSFWYGTMAGLFGRGAYRMLKPEEFEEKLRYLPEEIQRELEGKILNSDVEILVPEK